MNAQKRTPSEIIGEDSVLQLIFEGFQIIPILENDKPEPVAYQHRRIDKHGVEGRWEPFKRPLFETDRHESRALYTEEQYLAARQKIDNDMHQDLIKFQTEMSVLQNVLEKMRKIGANSIKPFAHLECNTNPNPDCPYDLKVTSPENKDAITVIKEDDVINLQKVLNEKIASLETQNKVLQDQISAQKAKPSSDLKHLAYIESDSGPNARYGFKTTCVSNPGAIAVTPLENAIKREKELLEIIEAFSMAHADQSGDQNYYLLAMQSAYEAGQKYLKKD